MHIEVLSLFPGYIEGPLRESILKRAIQDGLLSVSSVDIRDFSQDKDRRVDDRPYGGGPGMVMMAEPVVSAIRSVKRPSSKVIYLSPQGKSLTPALARELSLLDHLILLSGHYEGIDQRAIESDVDLEVSIGDYVLTNGCLAALVMIDVIARFIPGVLGHAEAAARDSFEDGLFDCPHYTRPCEFEGKEVPEVLRSGDHEKIEAWRKAHAFKKTRIHRPDLVAEKTLLKEPVSQHPVQQIVESSYRFSQSCRFYEKLFDVAPSIDGDRADFHLPGLIFSLFRVYEPVFPSSMFLFSCSQNKTMYIVRRFGKKDDPVLEGRCTVLDPDGRIIKLVETDDRTLSACQDSRT